jgi:predicted RND superfamily exporter protein
MGIFIILGREFNLSIIGAMLTIIGYSLNDTIVVYDRIRENLKRYRRRDLGVLINESVNETLSRTVNTALTTIMSITAFLFLGGEVIADFALAILLGVFFGTYSTVYVASPTILLMEDLRPTLARLVRPLGIELELRRDTGPDAGDAAGADAELAAADRGALTAAAQRRLERQKRRSDPAGG